MNREPDEPLHRYDIDIMVFLFGVVSKLVSLFCLFSICPMRLAVWFFPKDLPVLPASRLTQQPGMHLHTPKNLTPVAVPENDKLNNALKALVQNCHISDSHQLKNDLLV